MERAFTHRRAGSVLLALSRSFIDGNKELSMIFKRASTACLAAAVGLVGLAVIPHVDAK
jgi:hypothetical protein